MTDRCCLTLVVLSLAARVLGQSSDVTQCIPEYQWSINALGQTPCLAGSYLETLCSSHPNTVPALPEGNHYTGPSAADADPCFCNSVTYSMISACAGCQGRNFLNFSQWTTNCEPVEPIGQFPRTVPVTTQVPSWATLDIALTNNSFSPLAAEREAARQATFPSSTSSTSSAAATSTPANLPSQSTSNSSAKGSSGLSSGAIAGIVVGVLVAVIATLLVLLWMKIRSKKRDIKKQDKFMPAYNLPKEYPSPHMHSRSMSDPASIVSPNSPADGAHQHLPSESSTTYTTIPPMRSMDDSVGQVVAPAPPPSTLTSPRGYTGAAEV